MKTATTYGLCLVTMLLSAVSAHAQNSSWRDERTIKRFPHRPATPEQNFLPTISEGRPLSLKDYLLQWLMPSDQHAESIITGMSSGWPLSSLIDQSAFVRREHFFPSHKIQNFSGGVREAWVRHYASGLAAGTDVATAMAVDDSGNVYITGYSSANAFGVDYLTAKYDTSGNLIWTARYDGGNGEDVASSIVVDVSSNVYVTGRSWLAESWYDYATVKYNSAGVQEWVARYDDPSNDFDSAIDLAVDASGNVYVTGSSWSGTSLDFATVKYSVSGKERWVARYNNPSDGYDIVAGLELDVAGNIYVAGTCEVGLSLHYTTIKYNPSGAVQWVGRYHGPIVLNRDEISDLVVDEKGNVYVTGRSVGFFGNTDYATVKYTNSGDQEWVARYNGPNNGADEAVGIAIDRHTAAGSIYVTGRSYVYSQNYDYVTIKYTPLGAEQWVASYNNPLNSDDVASAIALDDSGHVFVTGNSLGANHNIDYVTVQYDSKGMQQWVARYDGSSHDWDEAVAIAIAQDSTRTHVYVTGWSYDQDRSQDYATVKYNRAGIEQWSVRFKSPSNSLDYARASTIDQAGNLYVTGTSYSGAAPEYATIKYTSAGVEQWVARYHGPNKMADYPSAIALDILDNVYVTGISSSGQFFDYATVKYNSSGVEQWVARYEGPVSDTNFDSTGAVAIGVDASGNVYLAGSIYASGSIGNSIIIKYNRTGTQEWVKFFNGPGSMGAKTAALAVDNSGNVFVTGSGPTSVGVFDYFTVKYNSAGEQQWIAIYDGSGEGWDEPTTIAIDRNPAGGYVYVTGWSVGRDGTRDYATVKYDSAGIRQWVARYSSRGNENDMATALAVDDLGNGYVTGGSVKEGTPVFATVKYNAAGEEQWTALHEIPGTFGIGPKAIALDGAGNVYITGSSLGVTRSTMDYTTIKYDQAGVEQWVALYNGPGKPNDIARSMAVNDAGDVYVAGFSDGTEGSRWSVFTSVKYIQSPEVSVEEQEIKLPSRYKLAQNYPNPFNPTTTIRYAIARPGHATLKVFNLQGQEVATLVQENNPAGEHEIQWNPTNVPSGVYVYRLQAGDFVETKKLVLLK